MRRLLLIVIVTLCQAVSLSYGQDNLDSLIHVLKIKRVNIFEADRIAATRIYNSNGYLIYHMNDNFVGGPVKTTLTIEYDANNNKIATKSTHSSFQGDTTYWLYKYDSIGNLLSIIEGYKKRLIFKYSYDSHNKKIKETQFDTLGNITLEESYKYNSQGLLVTHRLRGKYFKNRISKSYYDLLNREVKSETRDKGNVLITTSTEYVDDLNKKSKTIYQETNGITGVVYKYDSMGRLIKRGHYNGSESEMNGIEEFTYSDNGLIEIYAENIFSFSLKKRSFTYKYEY